MTKHGGKREGSGRPTRGARPTITKSFSLTPTLVERLEATKPPDESMSAYLERLLTTALDQP